MAVRVLVPASIVPSIFLAGPIQGARDWQSELILTLKEYNRKHCMIDVDIYNPRMSSIFDEASSKKISQVEQTTWETAMLNKSDIIAFYLPLPLDKDNIKYARASRVELGEWLVRHKIYNKRLVVCAESGFSGRPYIQDKCNEYGVELLSTFDDYVESIRNNLREINKSYASGYKHT